MNMPSSTPRRNLNRLSIRARRLTAALVGGESSSTFRGTGMTFEEVREYMPGDDVRSIDWNVTARTGVPHSKIFREEREISVILLVDVSASLATGSSAEQLKSDVILDIAAIVMMITARQRDRLGMVLFSDRVEYASDIKKGQSHGWSLMRHLADFKTTSGRGSDLGAALQYLRQHVKRRSVIICVSDFLLPDPGRDLKLLTERHEWIAVQVRDPHDVMLPRAVGLVPIIDRETGAHAFADGNHPLGAPMDWMTGRAAREGVEVIDITLNSDPEHGVNQFCRYLRRRHMRRRT